MEISHPSLHTHGQQSILQIWGHEKILFGLDFFAPFLSTIPFPPPSPPSTLVPGPDDGGDTFTPSSDVSFSFVSTDPIPLPLVDALPGFLALPEVTEVKKSSSSSPSFAFADEEDDSAFFSRLVVPLALGGGGNPMTPAVRANSLTDLGADDDDDDDVSPFSTNLGGGGGDGSLGARDQRGFQSESALFGLPLAGGATETAAVAPMGGGDPDGARDHLGFHSSSLGVAAADGAGGGDATGGGGGACEDVD